MGKTWATRSQTPIVQTRLNLSSLSIIGALSSDDRLFQHTHRHAIRASQVVRFLEQLLFFLPGPITVVLDRAGIHRARMVQCLLEATPRLRMVYLPAYSSKLNPIERLWAYFKRQVLANFVARDLRHLKQRWTVGFARVRSRNVVPACLRPTPN